MSGRLFVVAGPSGVGKGTLIARARRLVPERSLATSATTRPPREDERDGREYHFLSAAEFERRVEAGDFLEHVSYAGNRYGTLRSEVLQRLGDGASVVLEIEVAGAREIRRQMPDAVFVFVAPPTMADLEARLRGRRQNTEDEVSRPAADRGRGARGKTRVRPCDHKRRRRPRRRRPGGADAGGDGR